MAARVTPAEPVGIPADPAANGHAPPADEVLQVTGRVVAPAAVRAGAVDHIGRAVDGETMRALRLLALDNLIDIVRLRESLAQRDAEVAALQADRDRWRERALSESGARQAEASLAFARQRELVTVLHRQLIENDELHEAIAWRRRPWWRRIGKRGPTARSAAR